MAVIVHENSRRTIKVHFFLVAFSKNKSISTQKSRTEALYLLSMQKICFVFEIRYKMVS